MSKSSNIWLVFLSQLSRQVWALCRLRGNPADLPHSIALLILAAAFNIMLALLDLMQRDNTLQLLMQSNIALIAQMTAIALVLASVKKIDRFVKTATALFTTGIILSLFHLGLINLAKVLPPQGMSIILVGTVALLVWSLLITSHILRCAMEIAFAFSLFIAIGLVILSNIVVNLTTGIT